MDRHGQHILPDAGFTKNQYGSLGGGDCFGLIDQLPHGWILEEE